MKHFAATRFWKEYPALPREVQQLAGKSFAILEFNPRHPSLRMKKIGSLWSVRIGDRYRALGVDVDGGILWIWIGTHAEYDKLVT